MSKPTKIIITLIIVVIVVLIIVFSFQKKEEETIKIGFVGPLTGDGAAWGLIEQKSTELAVNEINNKGGVNGKKLEVIYEDGKCIGEGAVSAVNKLININKVKIILSSCSGETLPIAPVTERNKVILLATYSTNPTITNAGDYVFRNAYSDADIASMAAQTIIKKYKRIGVITELTDYAVGVRDAFRDSFRSLEGEVVEENFEQESRDIKTQISKIKSQSIDAIFVNPTSPVTGIVILKQLKELNYEGQVYGNFFGSSKEVQTLLEADGMIYFADPIVKESNLKKEFFEKYKARYGEIPDLEYPAATRYDAIYILKKAIEFCNGDKDTDCIRDYLYEIENFTGVLGTYGFDENGDLAGIKPSVSQIKNGQVFPYEE